MLFRPKIYANPNIFFVLFSSLFMRAYYYIYKLIVHKLTKYITYWCSESMYIKLYRAW